MLGAERLLRFFLEEPECSFDVFLRWYQVSRRMELEQSMPKLPCFPI